MTVENDMQAFYDSVLPIEEMPNLSKRLGKSGVERVRYPKIKDTSYQKGSVNIDNTVLNQMQYVSPNTLGCPINEYIENAASFNIQDSRPLNINRLFNILQCMEVVNTREVVKMTHLSEKQARKYVRAIKFILPFLEREFEKDH